MQEHLKRSVWYLDSGCSRHMTGVKQYLHRFSKEHGPKVVFGDNYSGATEGYGSISCNGITFTKIAYVNGLKHNLISISCVMQISRCCSLRLKEPLWMKKMRLSLLLPEEEMSIFWTCHLTKLKAILASMPRPLQVQIGSGTRSFHTSTAKT